MKKIYSILLPFLLTAGMLAGCNPADQNSGSEKPAASQTAEKASFPVTVKDAAGKEITIDKAPGKIVSLMPSNTEIAYDLGLGKNITGVSDFDNYPEEAMKKEKVGDAQKLNVEKILGMKPDLVLAHASSLNTSGDSLDQLRNAGIKVLVVNDAETFDEVYKSIELIGKASGKSEEAAKTVKQMQNQIAAIKQKAKSISAEQQKTVYVEVSPAPDIFTAGKGTFIDEILTAIGAKNAAEDAKGWAKMTEEAAVKLNPDSIVTTYGDYVKDPVKQIESRKGWESVSALKNKEIYNVNSDQVTRPGPRLAEGAEELAKIIYPDIYKK